MLDTVKRPAQHSCYLDANYHSILAVCTRNFVLHLSIVSMLFYRYQPLRDDHVRLLVLHPSPNSSDPIRCTIQHARLSDASLIYEAVSYTWGDTTQMREICFRNSKRKLFVGENCHNALQQLRLQREDRLLWIDAICINQENLAERASQVRIMDKIFDRASGVMVCLGEEVQCSRSLFGELAAAEELINNGRDCDLPYPTKAIIRELENLFKHPWFKRVWVLQEVCAKSLVTFMCGSASTSFDALSSLYFGYSHGTMVTTDRWPLPLEWIYRPPKEFRTPEFTLWYRLYDSRNCQATNPRDRVFALKSLVGSKQSKMDSLVNYTQSVEECFTQVGRFLLPVLGLRLLTAVRHPHNMEMPSWIPDWSQNHPLNLEFFLAEPEISCAAISQHASCFEFPGQPTHGRQHHVTGKGTEYTQLLVKGCQYARIKERSQVFTFVDLEDAGKQMKRLYYSLTNLKGFFDTKDMSEDSTVSDHLGRSILDSRHNDNVRNVQL